MNDKYQITNYKYSKLVIGICLVLGACILILTLQRSVQAQSCITQTTNPKAEGLISLGGNTLNNFGNPGGNCTTGEVAKFSTYKLPTYESLKDIYYTRAKDTSTITKHAPIGTGSTEVTEASIDLTGTKDHIYFVNGNLTKNGGFPQDANLRTGLVFVEGNFTIADTGIGYTGGLVFIVKGNIILNTSVTIVNAVLISQGKIYTAGSGCSPNNKVLADQLVINGSLVALNSDNPIQFCRTLSNNNVPSELINQQPKYLILLRDLMSTSLQIWQEVAGAPPVIP